MRGRGSLHTRALLIWVGMPCAVLVALGNYSVAQAQRPGDADDQTALAAPRIGLRGAPGIGLPQPLSPSEAARTRRIFSLQDSGAIADSARETDRLENPLLLGTILADRYLRGAYRATPAELTAWLARFGDQAEAPAIRSLLERVSPGAATPVVAADIAAEAPAKSARRAPAPSQVRSLFVQNHDAEAIAGARPLLSRAAADAAGAEALFVAGLAALRLDQADTASEFFQATYRNTSIDTWRAASAFWMGRIEQRRRDRGAFVEWMRRAAREGDSFYGQIARRALGPPMTCLSGNTIGNADIEALLATPQGSRAFALLEVGQKRYAEAELRALWADTAQDGAFDRPLVLVARAVGFSQLALEIEQIGEAADRRSGDAGLPRLQPAGGFVVDPPLVYALVRHESNFRPTAVSRSGAQGLMQLMPRTAYAVAGEDAARLHDPAVNLAVGQQYLLTLSDDDAIDGDLIRLLAGYGQGQGGLRKWVDAVHDNGDPLMFLEAIPNQATRHFIEDSLVYSWHYASVMRLPAASLDELAAGHFPRLIRTRDQVQQADGGLGGVCVRPVASR